MGKLKEQLAGIAALIGVMGAICAGFIKYGEVMSNLDSLEAFNPDPMMIVIGDNKKDIVYDLEFIISILAFTQSDSLSANIILIQKNKISFIG